VLWLTPVIPTTPQAESIGKITVGGQPSQKVSETSISANKLGMVVCSYNPSSLGSLTRRIVVQTKGQISKLHFLPLKSQDTVKNSKKCWGMV
jgi:hypothetical protein